MVWFVTHGLTWFIGGLVVFFALMIAGWIAIGFGAAAIVLVAMIVYIGVTLPFLLMYYDDSNPSGGRYPDALR